MKAFLLLSAVSLWIAAPSVVAAQTAAPAPAVPATTTSKSAGGADQQAKAAKSKLCSAQADQKGLHGKARKKFRDQCKRT